MVEIGAKVELMGRQAEVESGTLRVEEETRDPPTTMVLETDMPMANPHHRWQAEDELMD